ncbi:hypothetical protein B9Z55_027699 [Caenorhabditis nigoni]|uniref:Uncharacterized protein n=2 Tax=Caenorhabditis nigoni TaxID=1611254 RepID=A0A2G5SFE3_9PELO|nr:hypothetical protein B9Z55_027699 [Caenorhabditis nigoni]
MAQQCSMEEKDEYGSFHRNTDVPKELIIDGDEESVAESDGKAQRRGRDKFLKVLDQKIPKHSHQTSHTRFGYFQLCRVLHL